MRRVDVVIGSLGAATILLAAGMLAEIDSRVGPYEGAAAAILLDATPSGGIVREAGSGTTVGGVCVPAPPATACAPARLLVDVAVEGLPTMDPHGAYWLVVAGADGARPLGAMQWSEDRHVLRASVEDDGADLVAVEVRLAGPGAADPVARVVLAAAWGEGEDRFDAAGLAAPEPSPVGGSLRAAEIGAFSLSVTVVGRLEGLREVPGWRYDAWLEPTGNETWVPLGTLEPGGEAGTFALDARVERLRLEDHTRVVVTLVPAQAQGLLGLPVAQTPLAA